MNEVQKIFHITTSTTTVVISETVYLLAMLFGVTDPGAGSSWKVFIRNKETPTPKTVLGWTVVSPARPDDGLWTPPQAPRMQGGIDIVTTGTAGNMDVWLWLLTNP